MSLCNFKFLSIYHLSLCPIQEKTAAFMHWDEDVVKAFLVRQTQVPGRGQGTRKIIKILELVKIS